MVPIREIIEYINSKCDNWEIFFKKSDLKTIEFAGNKVEFSSAGAVHGMAVRIFKNGLGFSYTDNISDFRKCIDKALDVCSINPDSNFKSFPGKSDLPKVKTCNALENYNIADACNYYLWLYETLKQKKIEMGTTIYKKLCIEKRIINSRGVDVEQKSSYNLHAIESLRYRDINLEVSEVDNKPFSKKLGQDYIKRILSLQDKQVAPSKKMQLLLDADTFGSLIYEIISNSLSAINKLSKRSVFFDKLNKQVFDRKLTVIDDGVADGLMNSHVCDDEGNACMKKTLISKGALRNFLYDNYSAAIDNAKPTGNAFRHEFTPPEIMPTNLIVLPGTKKEMHIKEGLYIKGLLGLHTINLDTGDFSLGIYEGHYVKNGKIKYPLKDTMISGNLYTILNNIECLGSEIKHSSTQGKGGVYCPEVLIRSIDVIGQPNL